MKTLPANWKPLKVKAVDLLVSKPEQTMEAIAEETGVSKQTLYRWLKEPEFVEQYYERYMITFGAKLPNVLNAMIREAEAGNVQAGRLVLEHSGKLIKRVEVQQHQSPFEKFLNSENANLKEIPEANVQDAEFEVFPKRPEVPPTPPPEPTKAQIKKAQSKQDAKNKKRREARQWRNRAKAVGIKPPKNGRQSRTERMRWKEQIIAKEQGLATDPPPSID